MNLWGEQHDHQPNELHLVAMGILYGAAIAVAFLIGFVAWHAPALVKQVLSKSQ